MCVTTNNLRYVLSKSELLLILNPIFEMTLRGRSRPGTQISTAAQCLFFILFCVALASAGFISDFLPLKLLLLYIMFCGFSPTSKRTLGLTSCPGLKCTSFSHAFLLLLY